MTFIWPQAPTSKDGNFQKLTVIAELIIQRLSPSQVNSSIYPIFFTHTTHNMADALKAEGNKAFSAKDYPTAMYVTTPPLLFESVETVADMGRR